MSVLSQQRSRGTVALLLAPSTQSLHLGLVLLVRLPHVGGIPKAMGTTWAMLSDTSPGAPRWSSPISNFQKIEHDTSRRNNAVNYNRQSSRCPEGRRCE